jgi:hypothetical protein
MAASEQLHRAYGCIRKQAEQTIIVYLQESDETQAKILQNLRNFGTAGCPFKKKQLDSLKPCIHYTVVDLVHSKEAETTPTNMLFKSTLCRHITLILVHANLNGISLTDSMRDFDQQVNTCISCTRALL